MGENFIIVIIQELTGRENSRPLTPAVLNAITKGDCAAVPVPKRHQLSVF